MIFQWYLEAPEQRLLATANQIELVLQIMWIPLDKNIRSSNQNKKEAHD